MARGDKIGSPEKVSIPTFAQYARAFEKVIADDPLLLFNHFAGRKPEFFLTGNTFIAFRGPMEDVHAAFTSLGYIHGCTTPTSKDNGESFVSFRLNTDDLFADPFFVERFAESDRYDVIHTNKGTQVVGTGAGWFRPLGSVVTEFVSDGFITAFPSRTRVTVPSIDTLRAMYAQPAHGKKMPLLYEVRVHEFTPNEKVYAPGTMTSPCELFEILMDDNQKFHIEQGVSDVDRARRVIALMAALKQQSIPFLGHSKDSGRAAVIEQ